jgi:hypothetical protein
VSTKRIFATSIAIAALISASTIAVLLVQSPTTWESWRPASCVETNCFCETLDMESPLRQPVATWSSLAYVFPGVLAIGLASARRLSGSRLGAGHAAVLGIASIVVGVGSAFQHASATFVGQFFDILGMYLIASFILVYALERLLGWRFNTTLWLYTGINTLLAAIQLLLPDARRYIFGGLVMLALLLEAAYLLAKRPNLNRRWFASGLLMFALAYVIWILDNSGYVCHPTSLFQGHALWHFLGAGAIWLLFRHYQAERSSTPQSTGIAPRD